MTQVIHRNFPRLATWLCMTSVSTLSLPAQNIAPGSIDPSFAATVHGTRFILPQSNGHLFVTGRFLGTATNLMSLTSDGAYDPSFAPTSAMPFTVTALALQPDGKLLAGSQWGSGIRRFLPNGSLDPSFSFVPPDVNRYILAFPFWTTALAVQPDGRILIAGYRIYDSRAEDERYYWVMPTVYRLLPDGTLDSTFTPFAATVRGLAVMPDQRIVVAGADLTLLQSDGTRDSTFVAGPFSPRLNSSTVRENQPFATTIDCFAIQPNGRILVGGSFTSVQGHARSRLARVLPNGQLDLSFNPPAFTGTDFPEPGVEALALQEDGRILIGGVLRSDQWTGVRSLVRLKPDGSLDASFAHMTELFDDDEERLGSVYSIVIQDQTRAVIGGYDLDPGDLFRIHLSGDTPPFCEGFCIISFTVQPNSVTITWRSEPGETYYVEFKAALADPNWTPVSGGIIAQGGQSSWTGARAPDAGSAFFRVAKLEP